MGSRQNRPYVTAGEWLIPFNRPSFEGREHEYIAAAIASGHISGDGIFTKRCHQFLESELDVRPDTLNFDERQFEELITDRTRAAVPVHYAGVGCEMDQILEIAKGRGVAIVEDNAHGLFGTYRGKQLGTFGCMGTQSFHETKNFSCGEGGALLINDERFVERAEIIREKGTNRSRFFRGQVDKYTWTDIGSSYLPSELLSAALVAQFEARDSIQD